MDSVKKMNKEKKQVWIRRIFLILLDIICIGVAGMAALLLRFDFHFTQIDSWYLDRFLYYLPIHIVLTLIIFSLFHMYNSLWEFASINEMVRIIIACFVAELEHLVGMNIMFFSKSPYVMPRSFWLLEVVSLIVLVGGIRFLYRVIRRMSRSYKVDRENRVLLVGAGEAGNAILREIKSSEYLNGKVVCVVDDDRTKVNKYMQGVKIVGTREDIPWAVEKYAITDIFIAIPSLPRKELKAIIDLCSDTTCRIKALPGMYQIINDEVSVRKLRNVSIEDLLGRDEIAVENDRIAEYVTDKVVMVTGGGGSIGSELCRQIADYKPSKLVIVEIYENNAYDIQQELKVTHPELNLVTLIASVRNTNRMDYIFSTYKPEIVFHAAAHKHVPLMEDSPSEAIKNNVYGTLKLSKMCDAYGVKRMVLISTDKAVNPTNVMGASKRMCEMIVQAYNARSKTEFVAVRFGNVLGSNGSVIPLFEKQIAAGGPVTVTHKDIVRYFMTIPEAVMLVLMAGSMAKGGEIFVLDMGEPVKIDDMARNLIRLSGYVPDRDIEIVYTGLRPGEKLYEELLMDEEGTQSTENELIHIGHPIDFDEEAFLKELEDSYDTIIRENADIRQFVKKMVNTYNPT